MFSWRRLRASARSFAPRFRRYYMFTRLGFHFVFVAGFAMVGGALRGFNLLLVLAGVLVGALLMHWRCSRAMLGGVRAVRRLPTEAVAGVPFRVRYRISNRGRFTPAWMIKIEDRIGFGFNRKQKTGGRNGVTATCAMGYVAPKSTKFSQVECVVHRRGQYRFGPLTLSTTFPFSLMTASNVSHDSEPLFVYPRMLQLRGGWERNLLSRRDGVLSGSKRSGFSDGEFFGMREWRSGDNPKWIHWRTTARIGELAVRQFEQHRRFDMCILVDGFEEPLAGGDEFATYDADSDVERAISLAATLVVRLGSQPSNRVALATAATRSVVIDSGHAGDSQQSMLSVLAELKTSSAPRLVSALSDLAACVGGRRDLVVISSRSFAEAASQIRREGDEQSLTLDRLVAPWLARESFRWLDVRQQDVMHWVGRPTATSSPASEEEG